MALAARTCAQVGSELDALCFSARKSGGGLAQPEIAQSDLIEHCQLFKQPRLAGKEAQRFLDRQLQHLMDVLALVLNLKHLVLVAGAVAVFAGQFHIREKLHLDGHRAVALAGIASAAGHVEGEMSRSQRQSLGLGL